MVLAGGLARVVLLASLRYYWLCVYANRSQPEWLGVQPTSANRQALTAALDGAFLWSAVAWYRLLYLRFGLRLSAVADTSQEAREIQGGTRLPHSKNFPRPRCETEGAEFTMTEPNKRPFDYSIMNGDAGGRYRRAPGECAQALRLDHLAKLFISLCLCLVSLSEVSGQLTRTLADNPVDSVFLPAPRELRQELAKARESLGEKQYSDALARLDAILDGSRELGLDITEDFFLEGEGETEEVARHSLKTEAINLLGSMPEAGREVYELKHGATARLMLDAAVGELDSEKLAEVSRRFFHTQAGYEATMLLGRIYLERQRPFAAALCFSRIVDSPIAARQFDPEASVLLAASWHLAGLPDAAEKTLVELKQRVPDATVQIGERNVRLFKEGDEPLAWVEQELGVPARFRSGFTTEWTMYRGNAARNATTRGSAPLLQLRWRVPVANNPDDERIIEQRSKMNASDSFLPAMHPLVVNDTVLMRTIEGLVAVDAKTGRRIWPYPWSDPVTRQIQDASDDPFGGAGGVSRSQELQQRVWDDAPYGQLSSDGQAVFLLDQLDMDRRPSVAGVRFNPNGGLITAQPHNELVALELATEGKKLWQVGGETGQDETKLAGAYFLGAPLPMAGQLYALAEVRGEIRLVVLDSATGRLQWSQQLAHVDQRTILIDSLRRMSGGSPSFAEGVLVCPTSAGAIVAVDLANRSLLWGFRYLKEDKNARYSSWQRRAMFNRNAQPSSERWADASVTIAGGRVIATPVETDEIYCLDLLTGKALWPTVKRGNRRFVAAVHENHVILVGRSEIAALDLADGHQVWSTAFRGMPSGRGFSSGAHYYLATTAPELLKIDLTNGEIVDRTLTDEPLGNLLAYQDQILAQGTRWVVSFYQTERLRELVDSKLRQDPDDPWSLEHLGMLLLEEGRQREGLDALRQALSGYDKDDLRREGARRLLVQTLLAMLRDNEPDSARLAFEVEQLINDPTQRAEYLRLVSQNLHKSGKYLDAFRAYLELSNLEMKANEFSEFEVSRDQLVAVDRHLSVRQDRWQRAALATLWRDAPEPDRQQMATVVQRELANADRSGRPRLLELFGGIPTVRPAQLQLADEIRDSSPLQAELILTGLLETDDSSVAGQAAARLGRLYTKAGHFTEAAVMYRKLAARWADVACLEGMTGAELHQAALGSEPRLAAELRGEDSWPFGEVKITQIAAKPETNTWNRATGYPLGGLGQSWAVPWQDAAGVTAAGTQLVLGGQPPSIFVRDGLGNVRSQTSLQAANTGLLRQITAAKSYGHLFVVMAGTQLLGINGLSDSSGVDANLAWQQSVQTGLPNAAQTGMRPRRITNQWGLQRSIGTNGGGVLGPVTASGVVYRRWYELVCLNPADGEPVWQRTDVDPAADVWGDGEFIFVVEPNGQLARVFRTLDGQELRQCRVPEDERRLATLGRRVLTYSDDLADGEPAFRLRLHDPWTTQDVWSHIFPIGVKAAFVEHDELAILQADGGFSVIRIADGTFAVRHQLEADEQRVMEMQVSRSRDQYLLVLGRATEQRTKDVRYLPVPGSSRVHDVSVYAFRRDTGQMQWRVPAELSGFGLPTDLSPELPVLAFLRLETPLRGKREPMTTVALIDKRDGRRVFEKSGRHQSRTYEVSGNRDNGRIQLKLPMAEGEWTLDFTDQPRPPQPPTGHEADLSRPRNRVSEMAGAALDQVRRRIERLGEIANPGND